MNCRAPTLCRSIAMLKHCSTNKIPLCPPTLRRGADTNKNVVSELALKKMQSYALQLQKCKASFATTNKIVVAEFTLQKNSSGEHISAKIVVSELALKWHFDVTSGAIIWDAKLPYKQNLPLYLPLTK